MVNPRLAVTVTHGVAFKPGELVDYQSTISFYGKKYPILKVLEHPDMKNGMSSSDITLFILGEDVVHPEGSAVCAPVAVIDDTKPMPDPTQKWYAHSLSHSPNLKINSFYPPFKNTDFSTLYGKTKLDKRTFGKEKFDRITIGVSRDHTSQDPAMMVPIGGDSGSPLFVRLQEGKGFAFFGALARSSAEGWTLEENKLGTYTSLSNLIEWLKNTEADLIRLGHLPANIQRLTTVSQDQWQPTPDDLKVPKVIRAFDPAVYLVLNPDVKEFYRNEPFSIALERARSHYQTRAILETRRVFLSQATDNAEFDPMVYLALNRDLQDSFGKGTLAQALAQATEHYHEWASREGRPFNLVNIRHDKSKLTLPKNFLPKTYLYLNPDVATEAERLGLSAQDFAITHYTTYGFKEERDFTYKAPSGFWQNIFMYLALNKDLQQAFGEMHHQIAVDAFCTHYILHGFMEGRSYHYEGVEKNALIQGNFVMPHDFDAAIYLALNFDVRLELREQNEDITLNELQNLAKLHFETIGGPAGLRYR